MILGVFPCAIQSSRRRLHRGSAPDGSSILSRIEAACGQCETEAVKCGGGEEWLAVVETVDCRCGKRDGCFGQAFDCWEGDIAARGTNEVNADQLDELVLQVLDAVRAAPELVEFTLGDVGQPGQALINGQPHLGVDIEIQTEIHRP